MHILLISLFKDFLDPIDLLLTDVNLILNILDLQLCFFMDLLLCGGYVIQLGAHILNLLGLGCLDVCLSLNVLMALLDLFLGALISFIQFSLRVLGLCKLNLNVSE